MREDQHTTISIGSEQLLGNQQRFQEVTGPRQEIIWHITNIKQQIAVFTLCFLYRLNDKI